MNQRDAMMMALEALEAGDWYIDQLEMIVYSADDTGTHEERAKVQAAITALRAALAEPEQEPVGWQWLNTCNYRKKLPANAIPEHWRPLYPAPTPRKPLTDEEIDRVTDQQWAQNNHKPIYAAHRAYARAVIAAYEAKQGEQT